MNKYICDYEIFIDGDDEILETGDLAFYKDEIDQKLVEKYGLESILNYKADYVFETEWETMPKMRAAHPGLHIGYRITAIREA